nr:unnamed protein product [Callosobruchus chinensis]
METNVACARAGLPVVALNPALQSRELEYCINKIDVKCIICPEESKNYNFRSVLNELVPELENADKTNFSSRSLPSLKNVVFISEGNTR